MTQHACQHCAACHGKMHTGYHSVQPDTMAAGVSATHHQPRECLLPLSLLLPLLLLLLLLLPLLACASRPLRRPCTTCMLGPLDPETCIWLDRPIITEE